MNILVYPFQYEGDRQYSWVAAGLTDTVISDLNNINEISVFSDDDRKKAIREMELGMTGLFEDSTVVRVGSVMGANIIFAGSVQIHGNGVRINARLVNVESTRVEKTVRVDGSMEKIFELQDSLVISLITETEKISLANLRQVAFKNDERKKVEEKYKPKREAWENYAKGLEVQDARPDMAFEFFKLAIAADPEYIDAYIQAGYTAGSLLNYFTEALKYLKQAEELLIKKEMSVSKKYADVMHFTGEVYYYKGQTDRALEYYLVSAGIRDSLGLQETDEYADTLNTIGIVYRSKGMADKALEYYNRADKIRKDLGLQNTDDYAALMNNIGLAYNGKGEPDKALEYYLLSKNIRERLGLHNSEGYAALMNNIGSIYTSKIEPDTALEYLLKSKEVYEKIGLDKTVGFGVLMSNIASAYEMKGDKELAGRYYRAAYETFVKTGYNGKWKDSAEKNAKRLGK